MNLALEFLRHLGVKGYLASWVKHWARSHLAPVDSGWSGEVDAVVTWVDGSDPAWQRSRDRWDDGTSGVFQPARFRSRGEISYSLLALRRYLPWLRRIHVVTGFGQRPPLLAADPRLSLVDHTEFIQPEYLPTFSSKTIEWSLCDLPGLADNFLLLNDDCLIGRFLPPGFFFDMDGRPLVRLNLGWPPLPRGRVEAEDSAFDAAWKRGSELLDAEMGQTVDRHYPIHQVQVHSRRAIIDVRNRARFAVEVETTCRHRFRHPGDIPLGVVTHLALAEGCYSLGDPAFEVYCETSPTRWEYRLAPWIIRYLRPELFCLNDVPDVEGVGMLNPARLLAAYFSRAASKRRRGP